MSNVDLVERNRVIVSFNKGENSNLAKAVLSSKATQDPFDLESSSFTTNDLAEYIYNKKIPEIYRIADDEVSTDKDLNRFIHVGIEGGFGNTLDKAKSLRSLVNPLTCPPQCLPFLASSWGVPYFEDMGVYYNRKFLSNIGEFLKRRGSMGGVRYIIRALTGFDSDLEYKRISEGKEQGRYLYYTLNPNSIDELKDKKDKFEIYSKVVSKFLQANVPFYIHVVYKGITIRQEEELENRTLNLLSISSNYHYNLIGDREVRIRSTIAPIFSVNKANHYDLTKGVSLPWIRSTIAPVFSVSKVNHYDLTKGISLPWIRSNIVPVFSVSKANHYDFSTIQ